MSYLGRILWTTALLSVVGCSGDDTGTNSPDDSVPPASVTNLSAEVVGDDEIQLHWTATGDDGFAGQAASYEIRTSNSSFDAATMESAETIPQKLTPIQSGVAQEFLVSDLNMGTWFFSLRVADEALNWSDLSNIAVATVGDSIAPSTVADLFAEQISDSSVRIDWTAPGDDGTVGRAAVYDLRYASKTISASNWNAATSVADLPDPALAGAMQSVTLSLAPDSEYFFALQAQDNGGNWSGLSNITQVSLFPDVTPPSAVQDLEVLAATGRSVTLTWTASGDDNDQGRATEYDIQFSRTNEWSSPDRFQNVSAPQRAGFVEMMTLPGLEPQTSYFVRIRIADDMGNWSEPSNVVTLETGNSWLVFAVAGPSSDLHPTWSPDGSRLAFARAGDGQSDIRTTSPDGSNLTQVTSIPGFASTPVWSPDGRRIAFVLREQPQNFSLWVVNADGASPPQQIVSDHEFGIGIAGWSKDGGEITYVSPTLLSIFTHTEIYAVPSDGGESQLLLSSGDEWGYYAPSLSPDRTQIVLGSTEAFSWDLSVITLSTGEELRLTTGTPRVHYSTPTWSPDGTEIMFGSDIGGSRELYRMPASGGEPQQITSGPGSPGNPSWSVSEDRIAYQVFLDDQVTIWIQLLD